jgi:hypothetical protein
MFASAASTCDDAQPSGDTGHVIGIRLTGKTISAAVFTKCLANFVDLISDVDRAVSKQPKGSIRWELQRLQKNSPAIVEFAAISKSKATDYIHAVQLSVLDGLDKLAERPEQPESYSYSALESTRSLAEQAKKLTGLTIYSDARHSFVDQRVFNNIGYLVASGTVSLGSIRGSLDAITVHDGHEFRVWPSMTKRAVTCRFKKSVTTMLLNDGSDYHSQVQYASADEDEGDAQPDVADRGGHVPEQAVQQGADPDHGDDRSDDRTPAERRGRRGNADEGRLWHAQYQQHQCAWRGVAAEWPAQCERHH